MFEIKTPHPTWEKIITLPSPEWGDFKRSESTLQVKRSMTGQTVVTHIKKQDTSFTYEYQFNLTRIKSLELIDFFDDQLGSVMLVTDHHGEELVGYFQINPLELEKIKKANSTESVKVTLTFETVE